MTAKKQNELATGSPCQNGERASFPGPSMIPCTVQTGDMKSGNEAMMNWSHQVWEWGYDELESSSLGYNEQAILPTMTKKIIILPLSNCFLILRISFALPDTLYRPSTSRPARNNRTIITAVSLSMLTVDMEMGVWGRNCWMGQQGIVLGSTACHYTPQSLWLLM